MKIIVKPLEGIYWEGQSICLGEARSSVEDTLKSFQHEGYSDYGFQMDLRIDFDEKDCVEFIEFIGGRESRIRPFIYDTFAFEVPAEELFEVLKIHNEGTIDDSEKEYCYGFMNISVGIYRESTPKALAEFIKEMQEDGIDIEHNENVAIEREKASYWATLGIGCKNYYG